ncbi:MAG: oligosaccharide flippase family protein [Roseburia sp.]|nr:oligosaccharide flippase family protein [Roseburia sp.]
MKKNLLYSFLYEVIIALYPLLLIPYLSATIGKSGIGIYSYTYSIVGFFLLVCQLGVNTCGTRAIAKTRNNKKEMTRTFKCIFLIQVSASAISILAFLIYVFLFAQKYQFYFVLLLPFLIGQGIRISWFFLGLENIATILLRNVMIRLVSAVLIVLFVKTEASLPLYFLIMSLSYLLGDISVWPKALKMLDIAKIDKATVYKYIKPMMVMFLPILALRGAYYTDEIMLGFLKDTDSVAIYENVYKVVNMPLQLYTVLANVFTAQASHLVATKQNNKNVGYVMNSIDMSSAIMFPIIFGMIAIAKEFVPWYMGETFLECIGVMHVLPIVLIFSGITSILRTQYFIPLEQDRKYVTTIAMGVLMNIILNCILIPEFSYIGVAIATVISEMMITFLSVNIIQRKDRIVRAFRYFPLYLSDAVLMLVVIRVIGNKLGVGIGTNILQIICGGAVYLIILFGFQRLFAGRDKLSLYHVMINMFQSMMQKK